MVVFFHNSYQELLKNMSLLSDIDECVSLETNECDSNALCTNIDGSYVCRCLKSFEGDGRTCTGNTNSI